MKKVMFLIALVPFLAACWSKKDQVETTVATEVMPEPVVNPEQMPSEDMPSMADTVQADTEAMVDEK